MDSNEKAASVIWTCLHCGSSCESEHGKTSDECWNCGKTSALNETNLGKIDVPSPSAKKYASFLTNLFSNINGFLGHQNMNTAASDSSSNFKKIATSIVLGIAILFSWIKPLDSAAIDQVDAGLKRSLASFAVARALNAAISVAQGTEVSVQIGVGATFTPGQVLDPVNDIVEQFGDIMLAASVAFGVMHFLIKIGSFWLFSLTLSIASIAWIFLRWKDTSIPEWLPKAIVVLLLVRFSIPIMTVGSDFVFKQFLSTKYAISQDAIQIGKAEVTRATQDFGSAKSQDNLPEEESTQNEPDIEAAPVEDSSTEKPGIWGRMKESVANGAHKVKEKYSAAKQKVAQTIDVKGRLNSLKESTEMLVNNIVQLIVIFILQTIVMPALILWILYLIGLNAIRSIGRQPNRPTPSQI